MNRAESRLSLVKQCDERAKKRAGGGERLRAIDGIEHPHEIRVGVFGAELLPDHAVCGEALGNQFAQEFLRTAIGDGDRRVVGFGFNHQVRLRKVRADEIAASFGELCNE